MKKRIIYLLLAVSMILTVILPVSAADFPLVYDEADVLTDSEESVLIGLLSGFGNYRQTEIAIGIFNTFDDYSPMAFADDFYDYNGYGFGVNRDGLILVIAMDTRDWWISTHGNAIGKFTDAGIAYIGEQIVPYLSRGDYEGAFDEFVVQCNAFLDQADTGDPYDVHNLPKAPFDKGMALMIALVIGLLAAAIRTAGLKGQLKSVQAQRAAANYVKNGSMNVTESRDFFLYRRLDRTAKESSSSGTRSGGSSTHSSSSGSTHGGGGGKF